MTNLSVHRNNKAQRDRKTLRSELLRDAKGATRDLPRLSGYAIVAWDEDNEAVAFWRAGHIPASLVSEMCKRSIERRLSVMDAEDAVKGE